MDIIMDKTPFSCRYAAQEVGYSILYKNPTDVKPFPLLKSDTGNAPLYNICPATHCRSFIVAKTDDRFIVSKGNGLSYTEWTFLNTGEFGDDTLGLLLKKDALRDFHVGNEIASLGIRTNRMEYVLELNTRVTLPNGNTLKPILLQYDVACPYRIADARFMTKEMIWSEVDKWETANIKHHDKKHMVAVEILVNNLRILHNHGILHNAIHSGNYTWALELLDFELSHTPSYPYEQDDYKRHVPCLMPREILQTYNVIIEIASILNESINYKDIDKLFAEYNYDLARFRVRQDYIL